MRRVSDNTALRYIAVLWQLFTTVKDLELEISSLSQVQLVDAIHTLQRSRSHHASLHSLNVLKAIRWFASTVQPDGFPSLYQGLFLSKAWQSNSMRKEAIPLPLHLFCGWRLSSFSNASPGLRQSLRAPFCSAFGAA